MFNINEVKVVYRDINGVWGLDKDAKNAKQRGATYIVQTIEELHDLSALGTSKNPFIWRDCVGIEPT